MSQKFIMFNKYSFFFRKSRKVKIALNNKGGWILEEARVKC